jgi:hypothetical protein
MNQLLKILKVKDFDEGKTKPLHPHLPQPPACVLMVSPVTAPLHSVLLGTAGDARLQGLRQPVRHHLLVLQVRGRGQRAHPAAALLLEQPRRHTSDDGLPAHWNKFETYDDDFKELYRRTHDGRRYTMYQQVPAGHRPTVLQRHRPELLAGPSAPA